MTGGHPDIALALTLGVFAVVSLGVYAACRAQGYSKTLSRTAGVSLWLLALVAGLSSRFIFVGDREALALPAMAGLGGVGAVTLALVGIYRQRAAMRKAGRR